MKKKKTSYNAQKEFVSLIQRKTLINTDVNMKHKSVSTTTSFTLRDKP